MFLNHESTYRSKAVMARIAACPVTVCGAGALGGNLVTSLARQGFARLTVIDFDRVESGNLGTQPYGRGDVGALKVDVLSRDVYRAVGLDLETHHKRLDTGNARRLLRGAEIVVDCFDNSAARSAVKDAATACLHVGLAADYAELVWDPDYAVPDDTGVDPCEYAMARNLVLLAVAVAGELVVGEIAGAPRRNLSVTLRDLQVLPFAT